MTTTVNVCGRCGTVSYWGGQPHQCRPVNARARFEVFEENRYGIDRVCIRDTRTGAFAVFVDGRVEVEARCRDLNAGVGLERYTWRVNASSAPTHSRPEEEQ